MKLFKKDLVTEALENARGNERLVRERAREIPRKAVGGSVVLELREVITGHSYGDFAAPPSGWTIYVWVDEHIQASHYYGYRYDKAFAEYIRLRDTYQLSDPFR